MHNTNLEGEGSLMTNRNWVLTCAVFAALATSGAAAQQAGRGQQPARGTPPPPRAALTKSAYLSHDTVAGCGKGGTFLNTPEYMVQCSNRTGPGVVEIHTKETDIIYVIDGAATFVTGGTATELTSTNPEQPRGKAIQGGEEHHLTKGDIIVVPAGSPHWFKEVPTQVAYYVVKVLKP
jgi:mannose-6-phosphate isomerase-like protein (cupin superfamily)